MTLLDWLVASSLITAALILRCKNESSVKPLGYILENQVTHSRLLPAKAAHAFTYFTLSFLVSLNALENGQLDLGNGWIFRYGGLWGRLCGIRSQPYLTPGKAASLTIRQKLEQVLQERGFLDESNVLEDAWMLTMPSYLGYEGINPLTVYFCYKPGGEPWLVVLEIHNTFGETHVHVLEVGKNEETPTSSTFHHQWTFRRSFHVSPFNDRSGFYTISVRYPSSAPSAANTSPLVPPWPIVSVHLLAESPDDASRPGPLKLTALLRPTLATPLTSGSLLAALAKAPFTLLLSLARIFYVAWILHYKKRLDVYIRPEPKPVSRDWGRCSPHETASVPEGGLRWQPEGLLEAYARRRVEAYLERVIEEKAMSVSLIAGDPAVPRRTFRPSAAEPKHHLDISYLSPRFFTILFRCPSTSLALKLGSRSEGIFFASSDELFLSLFSNTEDSKEKHFSRHQWLRCVPLRGLVPLSVLLSDRRHVLDSEGVIEGALTFSVLLVSLVLEKIEKWIFQVVRARVVVGDEPWKQWERLGKLVTSRNPVRVRPAIGSVLHEG